MGHWTDSSGKFHSSFGSYDQRSDSEGLSDTSKLDFNKNCFLHMITVFHDLVFINTPPSLYIFIRSSWPSLRLQKHFVRIFYLLRQLTTVLVHSKLKQFFLLLLKGRSCILIAFVPGDFVLETFAEYFVSIHFGRSTSRLTQIVNIIKVVLNSMNISD